MPRPAVRSGSLPLDILRDFVPMFPERHSSTLDPPLFSWRTAHLHLRLPGIPSLGIRFGWTFRHDRKV